MIKGLRYCARECRRDVIVARWYSRFISFESLYWISYLMQRAPSTSPRCVTPRYRLRDKLFMS